MNKTVIKELQKLMALCMEINDKTEHDIRFDTDKTNGKQLFSVMSFSKDFKIIEYVANLERATLPNINKCRQKLLKYKEW